MYVLYSRHFIIFNIEKVYILKITIITPACNEEATLPDLINSVTNQTMLPTEWIIIDDGSVDSTSNVIKKASSIFSWIKYLRKEKKDVRSPGRSVMETFYFGHQFLKTKNYDFIFKIDADLVLPKNYIERVIGQFQSDKKIGICGGVCVVKNNQNYEIESVTNLDHVRGAIKCYRKKCFDEIGGLVKAMGWDTIDEHTARFKGWDVKIITDLQIIHKRPTHSDFGVINASYRNGQMLYSIRMGIVLTLGNCIKLIFKKPYLIHSISMILGYVSCIITRKKFVVSSELGKFIRTYRFKSFMKRLLNS